jgi:prepilin-type N-terminal cleavage/methylation domain-containing protein
MKPSFFHCRHSAHPRHSNQTGRAFSLIELLTVISIMGVMVALIAPAMSSLQPARDLTGAAYGIRDTLDQARAYAMAKNTYVYVGILEEDATQPFSGNSQTPGTGRLAVAVVASRDGTRGYDVTSSSIAAPAISSSNLVPVGKLQHFENTHLVTSDDASSISATKSMIRPAASLVLGTSSSDSVTQFGWPITSAAGSGQRTFTKVINFDPLGVVRLQQASNTDNVPNYIEIDLVRSHGNAATTSSNVAAIQIDGMTGSTRVYRP